MRGLRRRWNTTTTSLFWTQIKELHLYLSLARSLPLSLTLSYSHIHTHNLGKLNFVGLSQSSVSNTSDRKHVRSQRIQVVSTPFRRPWSLSWTLSVPKGSFLFSPLPLWITWLPQCGRTQGGPFPFPSSNSSIPDFTSKKRVSSRTRHVGYQVVFPETR